MPDIKADRPDRAVYVGCQEMAAWVKVAMNECVGSKEGQHLLQRLGPLHLPFSAPCLAM
jgi:hypothetical protein